MNYAYWWFMACYIYLGMTTDTAEEKAHNVVNSMTGDLKINGQQSDLADRIKYG